MASEEYTDRELMVSAAASEIEDGDTAFVGMRLPLIAFQVAVSTHAPNSMAVYESGVVRDSPADGFIHTMCDLPNLNRAVSTTGMIDIMSRLQRGDVDVGFLGGAEVDRYGNLNTTWVQGGDQEIRLPGSGGACDIACLADRTVLLMPHEPRRFVESVHYVTSPGHASDGSGRNTHPESGGGPSALVTSKATFGFDDDGELYLRSLHPGADEAAVAADFPWEVQTAADVGEGPVTTTPEPTGEELGLIRTFDPDGFWT
ncbi:CoA-transferase subunit beta [Halostagnicola kamekurae]|uniref:Glutaconate CoA-transferase subunit B n=1 Tax=Halostagnicola kamekurae TaxID=619731 RepID=A0A1I6TNF6_9EURY|nr:CoA-transferase [Halostagnicola kamekurae]SFS90736.1 glutaconate CoA-transferase subunit B [Halostagnicola kamekurae]